MEKSQENINKYDISKSNFFIDIPDNSQQNNIQESQSNVQDNIINQSQNINLNQNPQYNQNMNFVQNNNFYPTQTTFPMSNSKLYSNPQIQMSNQIYQNNPYMYGQPPQKDSQSIFSKVTSTAMNLIKKEDPINLITDIRPKEFESILKKSNTEIQCQKIEKSKLNDIEIKVTISNPRKINDSLLKNSYLLYDITTSNFNWIVNRRYSDFIWLRDTLSHMFPTAFMPQLPKKKIGNRRFEQDFVEKRMKGLQKFLDGILKNELIKSSDVLVSFLSIAERTYFEQQMKMITPKMIKVDSFIGIRTFEGKATTSNLSDLFFNNNDYFNKVEFFFKNQSNLIQGIKNYINNYSLHIIEAIKSLEEIEKGFTFLNQYYSKANLSKDISNTLEQFQIFFKNYRRIHINQAEAIRRHFNGYFKYLKNEGLSMLELIDRQREVEKDYNNQKDQLMKKKEENWKKMDITKWEMNPMEQIDSTLLFRDKKYAFSKMCFQENIILNNKEYLLGYFYNENINSLKKVLEGFEKCSIDTLDSFSKDFQSSISDLVNLWSNLASNF